MAYVGKINEQNPDQMFPKTEVPQEPGFVDRVSRGIQMDFPNASASGSLEALNAGFKMTPAGQTVGAITNAVSNMRDSRQPYPMTSSGGGAEPVPQKQTQAKSPADVLPPLPGKQPRNYLAEVEEKDRMFNAERDTPTSPHAGYVPPMRAIRTNPWEQKPPATADPGLLYGELVKRGQSHGDMSVANEYEKTLMSQIHAMLPGASPKEVRSVMTTINQAVRNPASMNPTQPGQSAPNLNDGSLSGAVTKQQQATPSFQKLGAGQSMYQVLPDGTLKHAVTAPGGAAEKAKGDQFKDQRKDSLHSWDRVKKEYDKNWDHITENVADPVAKEQALRGLNTDHFQSMGVPEDLAQVPVSFKSFLDDHKKTLPPGKKLTREEHDTLASQHRRFVNIRNRMVEKRFSSTLTFPTN